MSSKHQHFTSSFWYWSLCVELQKQTKVLEAWANLSNLSRLLATSCFVYTTTKRHRLLASFEAPRPKKLVSRSNCIFVCFKSNSLYSSFICCFYGFFASIHVYNWSELQLRDQANKLPSFFVFPHLSATVNVIYGRTSVQTSPTLDFHRGYP